MNTWFRNLRLDVMVEGRGEGKLTLERVGMDGHWALYLRRSKGKRHLMHLDNTSSNHILGLPLKEAGRLAVNILAKKFGNVSYWSDHPPKPWARGLQCWVRLWRRGWSEGREGLLFAKRKKGNQWAYYLAVKKGWRRYKHQYLTKVPREHRDLILFKPVETVRENAITHLETAGFEIMNWAAIRRRVPVPYRVQRAREERRRMETSREDEGVLGAAIDQAESEGWGQVRQELEEDGDYEALDEVEEWLKEDDQYFEGEFDEDEDTEGMYCPIHTQCYCEIFTFPLPETFGYFQV